MTRPIAALTLVLALLLGGAWAVKAQTTPTSPAAPPADGRVEFMVGDITYELDPRFALNACIVGERIDAGQVTLRVFGRTAVGTFEPLGLLPDTALTEDLGSHPDGYCIPLRDAS